MGCLISDLHGQEHLAYYIFPKYNLGGDLIRRRLLP